MTQDKGGKIEQVGRNQRRAGDHLRPTPGDDEAGGWPDSMHLFWDLPAGVHMAWPRRHTAETFYCLDTIPAQDIGLACKSILGQALTSSHLHGSRSRF